MDHWTPASWTTRCPRTSVWISWVQEQLLSHLLLLQIWVYTAATLVFHTIYTWLPHFQGNPQTWAENELWADKLCWQRPGPNHRPPRMALVLLWLGKPTCTYHMRELSMKLWAGQRLPPPNSSPRSRRLLAGCRLGKLSKQSTDGQNKSPDLVYPHSWDKIKQICTILGCS